MPTQPSASTYLLPLTAALTTTARQHPFSTRLAQELVRVLLAELPPLAGAALYERAGARAVRLAASGSLTESPPELPLADDAPVAQTLRSGAPVITAEGTTGSFPCRVAASNGADSAANVAGVLLVQSGDDVALADEWQQVLDLATYIISLALGYQQVDRTNQAILSAPDADAMLLAVYESLSQPPDRLTLDRVRYTVRGELMHAEELVRVTADGLQPSGAPIYQPEEIGLDEYLAHLAEGGHWVIDDVAQDTRLTEAARASLLDLGIQAIAAFPLFNADGLLRHVILAVHEQPHTFSPNEVTTLAAVSNRAGVALQNFDLLDTTRRQTIRLQEQIRISYSLSEIGRSLSEALQPDELLQRAAQNLYNALNVDRVALMLVEPEAETVRVVTEHPAQGHAGLLLPQAEHPVYQALLAARQTVIYEDVSAAPSLDPIRAMLDANAVCALMAVPILIEDEVAGGIMLSLTGDLRPFAEDEQRLAEAVAGQLAISIQNATLFDDLEQRVQARTAELEASEERFRMVTEQSLIGTYIIVDGDFTYVNPTMVEMFRFDSADAMIDLNSPFDLTHPDDIPMIRAQLARREAGETGIAHYQFRGLRADGTTIHVEALSRTIRWHGKDAIIGSLIDISDRQEAAETLSQLQMAVEQSVDGIAIADLDGNLQYANEAWAAMHGYTAREIIGQPLAMFHNEQQLREEVLPFNQVVMGQGSNEGEVGHVTKDGTPFPTQMATTLLTDETGQPMALVANARDITARKAAEVQLRESRQMLQTVLDHFPGLVFWKDRDSVYLGSNQAFAEGAGLSDPAQLIGKTDFELPWAETEAAAYVADDQQVMDSATPKLNIEETQYQADGSVVWLDTNKVPLTDERGNVIGVMGTASDITARKQAEQDLLQVQQRLRESEARYRSLFEATFEAIIIHDGGRVLDVNQATESIFGYTAEELIGQSVLIFAHESSHQTVIENVRAGRETPYEATGVRKDGSTFMGEIRGRQVEYQGELRRAAVIRDVTEQKRIEAEIRQLNAELEERVAARTAELNRRAQQLAAIADVSTATSSILDMDDLLNQSVDLIRERFDLYYSGIFLVDDAGEDAVLRAGTGEAGQAMLAAGHRLAVGGDSMIGQCVSTQTARIALDVGEEATRFSNPHLPDTRSEMALPLVNRGQAIGAMTIQSTEQEAFSEDDITTLQALADQIANAIANAQLYEQAQAALAETEVQATRLTTFFESANDAIFVLDGDLITECNPRALEVFGCDREDQFVGQTPQLFSPPTQPDGTPSDVAANARIQRAIDEGRHVFEWDHQQLDGTPFPAEVSLSRLKLGGKVLVQAFVRDITERKQAEQELNAERNLMRTIIDSSPDWIFVKDREHRYVVVNEGYASDIHMTPEELVGMNDLDVGFPEELVLGDPERGIAGFWEDDNAVMDGGETQVIPYDVVQVDGKERILNTVKVPLRNSEGEVWGVLGLGRDVTERERRAQQLAAIADVSTATSSILDMNDLLNRSVDLIRERFDLYYSGIFLVDEAGQYAELRAGTGDAGQAMLAAGHRLAVGGDSMIGQCVQTMMARIALDVGDDPARFDNPHLPDTHSEMALPLISRGEAIGAMTIQSTQEAAFTAEDITTLQALADQIANAIANAQLYERVQAALSTAAGDRARLQTIIDSIPSPIFFKDEKGVYIGCNTAFEAYLGRAREDIIGITVYEIAPPDLAETYHQADLDLMASRGEQIYESQVVYADGKRHDVIFNKATFFNPDGSVGGLVGTMVDITERKQAEAELNVERNLMRTLIDAIPDYIFVKDRDSRMLINNTAHAWLLGNSTPEEVVGKTDFDFFPQELAAEYFAEEQAIMASGEGQHDYEEESVSPAGESSWHLATKLPLRNAADEVTGLVGIVRDITARKQAELDRERRARQLATIAEISSATTSILQQEQLLAQAVENIRAGFDLYYVGIFLVDEARENAALRAGTGEAGRAMLDAGHQLAVGGDSMIGQCMSTRQARIALDVGEAPARFDNPHLPDTRSEMALPLISRGQAIGAMTIQSTQEAAFTAEDITTLQTLADQLASALQNANLFEQTQAALAETGQQAQRLALLNEMSTDLNTAQTLDEVYRMATSWTSQIITVDRASLAMLTEDRQRAEVLALEGDAGAIPTGMTLPLDGTAVGRTIREQRVLYTSDTRAGEELDLQKLAAQGILSTLSAPLLTAEGIIGTLNIGTAQANAYTTRDEYILLQIASLLTSAIENRRLITQIQAALADVRQNERMMRTIIDATPDWIFLKDRDHRYVLVNEGYARDIHMTPEELTGKDDIDVGFPEELVKGDPERGIKGFWADDDHVLTTGEPLVIPNDVVMVDDEERILNTIKLPLRDERGLIWGVLGIGRDVTERETRARQLALINEISTAASSILDLGELLDQSVNLIRDRFGLYYAGIFLIDEMYTYAELRAGTGEAGRAMLEAGHKLAVGGDSMIGQCISTSEPRIAFDVGAEAARFDNPHLPDTHSEMALPLVSRGVAIGAMTIQSTARMAFGDQDIAMLRTLADQLANVMENARLYEQTQAALTATAEQAERLAMLNEMGAAINAASDLNDVYRIATLWALRIVNGQRASLAMLDETGEEVELLGLSGEQGALPIGVQLPVSTTAVGRAIQTAQVVYTPDGTISDDQDAQLLAKQGISSTLSAPLVTLDGVIGTLNIGHPMVDAFDANDRTLFIQVTALLASAIENQRLIAQIQSALADTEEQAERLATIFAAANDAIFLLDEDRIVECNPGTLAIFGCDTEEQVLNHSVVEFSPEMQPDGRTSIEAAQQLLGATIAGDPQSFEWAHIKRDGTPFPAEVSLSRLELGDRVLVQAIIRDITERRRIQEERDRRAAREQQLNVISAKLQEHTDVTLLLNAAMQELGAALGARVGRVRLGAPGSREQAAGRPANGNGAAGNGAGPVDDAAKES